VSTFNPEKIRTTDFPWPVGTALRGGLGSLYTVVDRDGWAFLACCPWCEEHAIASGWYPQQDKGRFLPRDFTEAGPEWQAACRACMRDDYDVVPCPLPAGHDGDHLAELPAAEAAE
jgi:hypothetical protein